MKFHIMKTAFQIISIFLFLGIIGNALDNSFSPIVLILAIITSYFAWFHEFKEKPKKSNGIIPPIIHSQKLNNEVEKIEAAKSQEDIKGRFNAMFVEIINYYESSGRIYKVANNYYIIKGEIEFGEDETVIQTFTIFYQFPILSLKIQILDLQLILEKSYEVGEGFIDPKHQKLIAIDMFRSFVSEAELDTSENSI